MNFLKSSLRTIYKPIKELYPQLGFFSRIKVSNSYSCELFVQYKLSIMYIDSQGWVAGPRKSALVADRASPPPHT